MQQDNKTHIIQLDSAQLAASGFSFGFKKDAEKCEEEGRPAQSEVGQHSCMQEAATPAALPLHVNQPHSSLAASHLRN